jgi:hypothetical protein
MPCFTPTSEETYASGEEAIYACIKAVVEAVP